MGECSSVVAADVKDSAAGNAARSPGGRAGKK